MSDGHHVRESRGSSLAIWLLFAVLQFANVASTHIAQRVQVDYGYRQPLFLLFLSHVSFFPLFPIHVWILSKKTGKPVRNYLEDLVAAIHQQLSPDSHVFPLRQYFVRVLLCAIGIAVPGALWYASVTLTSISDVTALSYTDPFWTYVILVQMHRTQWELRKLGTVLLAILGVILIVYGGKTLQSEALGEMIASRDTNQGFVPTAPLLGDLLSLLSGLSYAFYEVYYKEYVALPDATESAYELAHTSNVEEASLPTYRVNKLPFGLHANFFSSCIGLCTITVLWMFLPILNFLGWERFRLPESLDVAIAVLEMVSLAAISNACVMVLLGIWGPVVTSVGGLVTVVLVTVSDTLLFGNVNSLTLWSVLGSSCIVGAFIVLSQDILKNDHSPH